MPDDDGERLSWIESPTPEGLVVHERKNDDDTVTIQEIGAQDQVVYEYALYPMDGGGFFRRIGENAEFLVRRVKGLEEQLAEARRAAPQPLKLAVCRKNLEMAVARLKRLLSDLRGSPIVLPPDLSEMAERVSEAAVLATRMAGSDAGEEGVDVEEYRDEIEGYARRRLRKPSLVVSRLPGSARDLLAEAWDAYCHGLFASTAVMSRALLEHVLENAYDRLIREGKVTAALREEKLRGLISAMPDGVLSREAKDEAQGIRRIGNKVLHAGNLLSEQKAIELVARTTRLIEITLNRT